MPLDETKFITMKKAKFSKWFFLAIVPLALMAFTFAGNLGKTLPDVDLTTLEGKTIPSANLKKQSIISFWSTTCVPCIKELNAINANYDNWKKSKTFEVYAVSTDDARFAARVPLIANKKGWKFPVLRDEAKAFFKAFNVTNNPYTIVVNAEGKIIYESNTYLPGDEAKLFNALK